MNSYTLDEIYVGQKASVTKTITKGDIYTFAGLVDDYSPVHVNKEFGEKSPFGQCIAHGFLSGSLFSTLAGNYLPGAGSLYVRQSLNFLRPVYAGDTITATVTVRSVNSQRNRAELDTVCTNQDGVQVVTGTAKVMPPKG